ncbi:ABC transporter, ATP-binding protein [Bacteriovorax sp. BAL6_X]|uniref:ABC transporter ATP-binding protein n=1 Tax=Bacteriovorax sp. BAL6_X TaxID=1201290 RepID=UPI000386607C|nr:ABC transporter ATP-binding protein [Bacteriovorax sp. BAL6_X]EPZ52420.1 ABC transporter, ATP-binding protein [Bacteriovorax sp. BAL6_X]
METQSPLHKLINHFKNKRGQIYTASFFSILNKVFDIAPPLLIGLAVDTVVKQEDSFLAGMGVSDKVEQIYILGFLTFVIWALESLFEYLLKLWWRGLAQEVQHDLRMEAYDHLQNLHISFYQDNNSGNLATILNDDINQLERFLDVGANDIIQTLTTVVSIGGIFFYLSPQIALLSLTPVPFILWGSFYFQKKVQPRYQNVRSEAGLLASMLVNNIAGMMTIKSYVAQKFEYDRLEKQSNQYAKANKDAIRVSSSFSPIIRMAVLCGFLFTLIIGGIDVLDGKLEVGSYSVLIFLVQRLLWPLTRLGETFDLYQRSMASTSRVMELIETEVKVTDGGKELQEFKGAVEFSGINFKYDEEDNTGLKDINLKIDEGQTIALVGPTGSGKSTMLKLLQRFYDPQTGAVNFDGHNIRDLKQNSLRSHIGFVSQETYLFHGSVLENIIYGSQGASEVDAMRAAKLAEAHDFIELLPNGYQTIVGERGQKLSGGQRQRIAIARAILKDPKLFIFDEATSAIDNETEAAIQRSLKTITKGRTTVMVAHRLSTIIHADQICVLNEGKIEQRGTHEELIAQEGLYKALWNVQTGAV